MAARRVRIVVTAGNAPAAIQARAGHADFSTTQRYINLAGVVFP